MISNRKDIVQAVVIAGLSALATGLIGIVVKKIEKKLEKKEEPGKVKKVKTK